MKRFASILILAILVVALLPLALAIAGPVHTPHEDPDAAEIGFDISLPILLHYADVLALLAQGKYQDAKDLLEQLDLEQASIPDDIRSVMQTYNGLLSDLSESLDGLDALLDEAELLLEQGELEQTRLRLTAAGELIEEARVLLADIDEVTEEIIRLLGPFALPVEVEAVDEAKAKLREAMQRLEELEALYAAALQSLEAEVEQQEEVPLETTAITVQVDKLQVWVGDTITVSGILSSSEEGETLSGRVITIFLDNKISAEATTDADGSYQGTVDIPYCYVNSMTVHTEYVPEGDDKGKYQSCSSDSVDVDISFYQTRLEIEVPEQAYPGLPLKIEGEIGYETEIPPVERQIKVLWDDEVLATFYCSQDAFQVEATLDAGIEVGEYTLMVIVEAQEHYSDAFRDGRLTIVKGLPEIRIDKVSFMTLRRKMRIEGQLLSELPLQGGAVTIKLGDASTVVSASADGEFEASLSLPLGSVVMGSQEVTVTAEPLEAWHLSAETTTKVFVVDVVNLGLISAAFVSIGVVLYARRRGKPGRREAEVLEASLPLPEPTEIALRELEELKDSRGRILKAYVEAVGVAEKATKVSMKPYMTLREFLREILPELDGAAEAFVELTRLSERALYSPYAPGEDEAMQAESLVLTVKEMLRRGIA